MRQQELIDAATARLREASRMSEKLYHKPLVLTFSGGKDSSVCLELAHRAGIRFEVLHNHTTADAPETVYFVRDQFKAMESCGIPCEIQYPTYKGRRTSMWQLIPEKLTPPTRIIRYCCSVLKEGGQWKIHCNRGTLGGERKTQDDTGAL